MRTFTLFAAGAAVVFGLATAPAMADSFSFSYSTVSPKTPKHYGGSGYNHGYKYGNNYSYRYKKPYFGRFYDRRGYNRYNRFAKPKFGLHKYGYYKYGYHAPKLSKHRLIRHLKRQRFSRVKRVRFSHGYYHVWARDYYGRRVKLRVDPYTGRIVAWRRLR